MISQAEESAPIDRSVSPVAVTRVCGAAAHADDDVLATEEPLEIRIIYHREGRRKQQPISVTMRTPGEDESLAAGFLLTEGIIQTAAQVEAIHACKHGNVIRVRLHADASIDLSKLQRHFYTSSSCGVCGKTSIEAVQTIVPHPLIPEYPVLTSEVIRQAPQQLRSAQAVFERTGGLHACALFDAAGQLLRMSEDVGRHNAMDKLIGGELRTGADRFRDSMVLVSGRASFELVQKALMAGIPILAAIGAPSSLAVQLAEQHNMTLIGFVRADRFNIYCGRERIGEIDCLRQTLSNTAN